MSPKYKASLSEDEVIRNLMELTEALQLSEDTYVLLYDREYSITILKDVFELIQRLRCAKEQLERYTYGKYYHH